VAPNIDNAKFQEVAVANKKGCPDASASRWRRRSNPLEWSGKLEGQSPSNKTPLAERKGFEPLEPLQAHLISNQAPSATRTSLRWRTSWIRGTVSSARTRHRLAEREGFEPSVPLRAHMISSHAPSATRSSLPIRCMSIHGRDAPLQLTCSPAPDRQGGGRLSVDVGSSVRGALAHRSVAHELAERLAREGLER
jgi:hypothetical protein